MIATVGCVPSSCVIVMGLACLYHRFRGLTVVQGILAGLRPAVVAMIASAGISLVILSFYKQRTLPEDLGGIDAVSVVIFLSGLVLLRRWKADPIYVMAGAGVAGVLLYSIF